MHSIIFPEQIHSFPILAKGFSGQEIQLSQLGLDDNLPVSNGTDSSILIDDNIFRAQHTSNWREDEIWVISCRALA